MRLPFRENGLVQRAQSARLRPLMQRMESDVAWFARNFQDDPAALSGWGHHYFCDTDGALLQYNRTDPLHHRCPQCGKIFTQNTYREAWRYLYRYEAFQSAYEAAALYRITGDRKYALHIETILGYYATHYEEFVPHGEASGLGRITPQMLDESVFMVRAVCAVQLARSDLSDTFLVHVTQNLLLPAARFVAGQKKGIHNISCWINACLMGVGLVTGSDDLVQEALYASTGLIQQVRHGVTADHFWFEGSLHYNFYTIEALLHTLLFADQYGAVLPDDVRETIHGMMISPCRLAFRDKLLPNPNDGWPNIGLQTYAYLYELAAFLFDDPALADALRQIEKTDLVQADLPMGGPVTVGAVSLEHLLYGTDIAPQNSALFNTNCHFPASNYAMLRNDVAEIFVKYGHQSPSHAHPDKMNLEVHALGEIITSDPSNCGYAAPLCGAYYRRTHAHNTVMLDGLDHPTTVPGFCDKWEPGHLLCVRAADAYPGVDFLRQVELTADGFRDTFTVTSRTPHWMEWFFHIQGSPDFPLPKECTVSDYNRPGIDQIRHMADGSMKLCWRVGSVLAQQTLHADGAEILLGKSAGNPANTDRNVVIMRLYGSSARFCQEWRFTPV